MQNKIEVWSLKQGAKLPLPLFLDRISAGFPSPAGDYMETRLDLNEHLIKHPAATFFVRVSGDSMIGGGIHPGDILVVDRALDAADGQVVIAAVNGELLVKRLQRVQDQTYLYADNPAYAPIKIDAETDFQIWGVVTNSIHKV